MDIRLAEIQEDRISERIITIIGTIIIIILLVMGTISIIKEEKLNIRCKEKMGKEAYNIEYSNKRGIKPQTGYTICCKVKYNKETHIGKEECKAIKK